MSKLTDQAGACSSFCAPGERCSITESGICDVEIAAQPAPEAPAERFGLGTRDGTGK